MTADAHIYNPKNNSFQERIRSYKTVLDAYQNMEASIGKMHDKEWSDRLGDSDEVAEAQAILNNSLKIASTSIKDSEIRKAEAQGLLTPEDMKIVVRLEREMEMQTIREEKLSDKNQQKASNSWFRQQ